MIFGELKMFNQSNAGFFTQLSLKKQQKKGVCPFDVGDIAQKAERAAEALKGFARLPPQVAAESGCALQVKAFLSNVKPFLKDHEAVKKCIVQYAAFRMGVDSRVFDEGINPGFLEYVTRNYIYEYLSVYKHTVQVGADFKVEIMHQGRYVPWADVAALAAEPTPIPPIREQLPEIYNGAWRYGQQGVQNRHFYPTGPKLEPYLVEPGRTDKNEMSLCTQCDTENLQFIGANHSFNMFTLRGEDYGPGLYREDNKLSKLCETKYCWPQNTDCTIFWGDFIHRVTFDSTEKHVANAKAKIEQDMERGLIPFNVVGRNCTVYALSVMHAAHIDLSACMSGLYEFVPTVVTDLVFTIYRPAPPPVRTVLWGIGKMMEYPLGVAVNFLQLHWGAKRHSDKFTEKDKAETPAHFASNWDVLKMSKLWMGSPYMIATDLVPRIRAEREAEAKRRGISVKELGNWVPPFCQRSPS